MSRDGSRPPAPAAAYGTAPCTEHPQGAQPSLRALSRPSARSTAPTAGGCPGAAGPLPPPGRWPRARRGGARCGLRAGSEWRGEPEAAAGAGAGAAWRERRLRCRAGTCSGGRAEAVPRSAETRSGEGRERRWELVSLATISGGGSSSSSSSRGGLQAEQSPGVAAGSERERARRLALLFCGGSALPASPPRASPEPGRGECWSRLRVGVLGGGGGRAGVRPRGCGGRGAAFPAASPQPSGGAGALRDRCGRAGATGATECWRGEHLPARGCALSPSTPQTSAGDFFQNGLCNAGDRWRVFVCVWSPRRFPV